MRVRGWIDRNGYFDSLNEYLSNSISNKEDSTEFKVVENNTNSALAGRPAYKLVFDDLSANGGVKIRALEYGTMIDSVVYYVSYYAERDRCLEYLPLIQRMVNSFKITDVGLEPIQLPQQNRPFLSFSLSES